MLKNLIFLSTLFIACSFSVKAQETTADVANLRQELFSTYGFCKSQEFSLQKISGVFPQLQTEVLRAESEFKVTFGKSCAYIQGLLADSNGAKLDEMNQMLKAKLDELNKNTQLTNTVAANFINSVRERAKGNIQSPFKETLLAFNPDFDGNPAAEFSRGFTKKYRTVDHPKAKGLDLEISIPMSWKAREGNRPNVVQFFKSKNGYADASMLLMVKDFTPPKGLKITQKDIDAIFTPTGLKDFVPDNSTLIESKSIVLEGQKGGMLVYDTIMERLDIKLKMRTLMYITVYKNRMISIQFAIGDTQGKTDAMVKEFNKNRPLFQLIANSFIIMDKYK